MKNFITIGITIYDTEEEDDYDTEYGKLLGFSIIYIWADADCNDSYYENSCLCSETACADVGLGKGQECCKHLDYDGWYCDALIDHFIKDTDSEESQIIHPIYPNNPDDRYAS